jgi:hypothetical protein
LPTWGPQRTAAIVAINVFIAVLLAVGTAASQTVELNLSGFSRNVPFRGVANGFWLNREDCLADDVLHVPARLGGNAGVALTVWASDSLTVDCRIDLVRQSAGRECWKVLFGTFPEGEAQIDLPVREILARGQGAGPRETCIGTGQPNSSPQTLGIWFMYVLTDERSQDVGQALTWLTNYDLLPPAAPLVSLASEAPTLSVHWSQVLDADVAGYRLYCDSAPAPTSPDTGPDDASTGGVAEPPCVSSVLLPSLPPSADATLCGVVDSKGATEAELLGLTGGQRYAVAVAAYDRAGNVGPLSNAVCGTQRQRVVDIDGRGGCACVIAPARPESPSYASLALWLGLSIALATRRRSSRRLRRRVRNRGPRHKAKTARSSAA